MKKIISLLLFLTITLAVIYTGFWFYTANKIEKEIKNQISLVNINNVARISNLDYKAVKVTGFPNKFAIDIEDITVNHNDFKFNIII